MRLSKTIQISLFGAFILFATLLPGCVTSKKMDNHVAKQYDHEIPKQKKLRPGLTVKSAVVAKEDAVSVTDKRKVKVLPLLLYWKIDQNLRTGLNPAIAVNHFANSVNGFVSKELGQKLEGQKLELQVEKVPSSFAFIAKNHVVFALIYYVQWGRVYIEPDVADFVVSYKLTDSNEVVKTGRITIKNSTNDKDIRFFQSWKSAISETVEEYNRNITTLTLGFMKKLEQELASE